MAWNESDSYPKTKIKMLPTLQIIGQYSYCKQFTNFLKDYLSVRIGISESIPTNSLSRIYEKYK